MHREIQDLEYYYNKFKYGEDIFHNLMQHRVKNILLVSTFYDAFILEQEGRLAEELYGEYKHLDLSNYPYIVAVPTGEQAVKTIAEKDFDLVITMENTGKISSHDLASFIKNTKPDLPVVLLLNKVANTLIYETNEDLIKLFDGIFCWQGDAKIFLTIIKLIEDRKNLQYDTGKGLVRIILLYEKSIRYYSKFLSFIYYQLVHQTQKLISEEYNDVNKRLRMRARPKVVLTNRLEEAWQIYDNYHDCISCVISSNDTVKLKDAVFTQNDSYQCGFSSCMDFYSKIREKDSRIVLMMHSDNPATLKKALALDCYFLYDNSSTFWRDFKSFLHTSQGFGDFVFRDKKGNIVDAAKSMRELEDKLEIISDESLKYHTDNNHFSTWLIAHGEFQIAKVVAPKKVEDFRRISELREYLRAVFQYVRTQKDRGKIVDFNEYSLCQEKQIVRLSYGSLGGKGRGLAFLNALMETMELDELFPDIAIKLPCTSVIGTDEFDYFIEHNNLHLDYNKFSDKEIDRFFVEGTLSEELRSKLRIYIKWFTTPLAVRSSGLLEDSQSQPFAGVYRTYMLPNSHPDDNVRLLELEKAIKLIYASIYLKSARDYIEGINYKIEEEKMAVILQEVVGRQFDSYFYPHFSGVAESYNYYPTSYIKHQDGIASLAVGLGKTVVDRERSLSFCPKYPKIDFTEPFKIVENSQRHFYAVNLDNSTAELEKGEDETLTKLLISKKDKENQLLPITSIWDYENNIFHEAAYMKGPRVVTFRSITHYTQYPLSELLLLLLDIGEKAMGIAVEIEFAVVLPKNTGNSLPADDKQNNDFIPKFYLLQIRPLNVNKENLDIDLKLVDKKRVILFSNYALGNGLLEDLYDLIYLDPESFDNSRTLKMRDEIEYLNNLLREENKNYILIGPGRWGSSDRHLGIPVKWGQINRAKVIVEVGLKKFNVEASQGSHFFQNVFAMNVGYFTVPYNSDQDFVDWEWLKKQKAANKTEHFVHLRSDKPFITTIDGKKGAAIVNKPG